jgi:hypothetical protein
MSSAQELKTPADRISLPPIAQTVIAKNLVGLFCQPTMIAIAASVGLHGIAVAAIPILSPIFTGQQLSTPIETNLLELNAAERARLPRFSTPVLTVPSLTPPGASALNPSKKGSSSGNPSPLSGLQQAGSKSGLFGTPFGSSSEVAQSTADGSGNTGNFYGGVNGGLGETEYYYMDGSRGNPASGYGYSYGYGYGYDGGTSTAYIPNGEDQAEVEGGKEREKVQIRTRSQTPPNGKPATSPGQQPNQNPTADNNPDLVAAAIPAEQGFLQVQGTRPPMLQDFLRGNYRVEVRVDAQGNVMSFNPTGNSVVDQAIAADLEGMTFTPTGSDQIYNLAIVYDANSPTTYADGTQRNPTTEVPVTAAVEPTEDSGFGEFVATNRTTYPNLQAIDTVTPILISAPAVPVSDAIVGVVTDVDGTIIEIRLLQSSGDRRLDEVAIERVSSLSGGYPPTSNPTVYQQAVQFEVEGAPDVKPTPTDSEEGVEAIEEITPVTPAPTENKPNVEQPETQDGNATPDTPAEGAQPEAVGGETEAPAPEVPADETVQPPAPRLKKVPLN